jgi:hypothetical protein
MRPRDGHYFTACILKYETQAILNKGPPDQTFDILLIGFDVKIRSKTLIRVRSVYWSNSDQKPPYSPIKTFTDRTAYQGQGLIMWRLVQ